MAGPFIFIGTHRLKDGKFESFQADSKALAAVVESNEPRMTHSTCLRTRRAPRSASYRFTPTPRR